MGFGWFWAVFREACVGGLGGRYDSDMAFFHHSPSALGKHGQVAAFGSKDLRQPHPHHGGIFFVPNVLQKVTISVHTWSTGSPSVKNPANHQ